ncbi:MAG TPA: polymer-forming cytoskeletal protein [Thermoanaerobaculia bacterium]|nr:polymer-forming cytoskeletal protein [Thermoanaerobaculia bacterium]
MWIPSDPARTASARRWRRISFSALAPIALAALLLSAAVPATAQLRPRPAAPAASATPERAHLRQTIQRLYEVLPVRGGLLLKPRTSKVGVKTIELAGGNIAVNGEPVTASVLRAWLGDDAPAVLQLSEIPPTEGRQLFGLSAAEAEGAAPTVPAAKSSEDLPNPRAKTAPAEPADADATEETAAPTPPEPPEPPTSPTAVRSGPRVRVGGGVRVEANEIAEDVVAIGGPVHVDGEATGDVTAIGGSATINGKVGGGVTAVAGSVHLGPKADVSGDVTSVMGHIDAAPGAKIHGTKTEVSPGEVMAGRHRNVHVNVGPFRGPAHFVGHVMSTVLLALLACLILLVARPTVERLDARVIAEPWKAGLVGFLSQLFFLPLLLVVTLVLVISIVGCALLLLDPFLVLALLVAALVGFTAVAYRVGRLFESRFQRAFGSPYVALLVGIVMIEGLSLLGRFFDLVPFMGFLAVLFLMIGGIVLYCAWTVGFGVFVLDRWDRGFRRQPAYPLVPAEPLPPPPPAPVEPPREPWEPGP